MAGILLEIKFKTKQKFREITSSKHAISKLK